MRIGCLILLPLCLAVAASAEDTVKLPDPFIDGLFIGDIATQVEAALKEDGWETTSEWYNLDIDPIYRVTAEKENLRLFYEFNVYGRLGQVKYLEQWPAIKTRDNACETWSEWLSTIFGASDMGDDGYPHWASEGYEAKMYNRTFYDDLNTMPTVMITIFPKSNYVLPTENEVNIKPRGD